MKKLVLLSTLIIVTLLSQAQYINLNPDPNGEPWIVGGLRELTPADYDMLAKIPRWQPINRIDSRDLPAQVDNSVNPWFRPIFSQDGGSCGQASGVGYNFTYEIDYERQVPANVTPNQYPTHFTWNFLNGGVGGGSWYFDGWMIIREAGCPTVQQYGGMSYGGQTRWMTGYDKYYDAMFNRTLEFYSIDVSNYEGLSVLKQWLYSRNGDDLPGGLANFGAGIGQSTMSYLPAGTPNAGKPVIIQWGTTSDHAMTFVGYDDDIVFDFNGDGQYTDDIDINGDGEVNLRDCEKGGMLMANSWGTGWGFSGKAYVMYKLLADPIEIGGIWSNTVHLVQTKPDAAPMLTLKTTITYNVRNKIKIMAGVASNPNATEPEFCKSFPMFSYQGGELYMQGGSSTADKTIEIGLDITDLLTYAQPGQNTRFFLQVVEQDAYSQGTGEVVSLSVIDYTNGQEEVISEQQNIAIQNNDTTLLWVNKAVDFDKVEITTNFLEEAMIQAEYSAQLEAEGGTPPYSWSFQIEYEEEPITGNFPTITSNQLAPTNDDDGYAIQPIDFDFIFYGKPYNELTILTDGAITFTDNFSYIRDDAAIQSNRCISAYCADLMIYPSLGDGIFYEGDETHATFRWKISKFDEPDFDCDVAITLYPDGNIQFFYGNDITPATDWSAGVSDGDGASYLIANIAGSISIPDNYALQVQGDPFPMGMSITENGLFYGIPVEIMTWEIPFKVTDYNRISSVKYLEFISYYLSVSENYPQNDLLNVSPNPVKDEMTITFNLSVPETMEIGLLDISGKEVYKIFKGAVSGNTSLNENLKNILPGAYFLYYQAGMKKGIEKIIIVE